jgi:hypothetical protein
METAFKPGDWVVINLPDKPVNKAIMNLNGSWGVVLEILDEDNDLYKVQLDDGKSTLEADGSDLLHVPG